MKTNAPAKINLYLHVTGRREDGYHLLDSLVAFTNIGDALRLEPAESFSFEMDGPMAAGLEGQDPEGNLVVRAARALGEALGKPLDFRLILTKNLPVASGIGGGSTDGAAALRLLAAYWGLPSGDPLLHKIAASLGQDVPCCIEAETCYFRDIGNVTDPGPALPHADLVLVNPNIALPTPGVFKARTGPFAPAHQLEREPQNVQELAEMLAARGNGLTEAAIAQCPQIRQILDLLAAQPGCLLARMSGSGATCFGLFADRGTARQAASALYTMQPDWWVVPAFLPAPVQVLTGREN